MNGENLVQLNQNSEKKLWLPLYRDLDLPESESNLPHDLNHVPSYSPSEGLRDRKG